MMLRWGLAAFGVAGVVALFRWIGVGRKLPPTFQEQRTAAWAGPKRYHQTQPANRWKLRMPVRAVRRRSA